jgi:hypothetical protein
MDDVDVLHLRAMRATSNRDSDVAGMVDLYIAHNDIESAIDRDAGGAVGRDADPARNW